MSSPSQMYNFPYEPYPEQRNLMHAIYECIDSSSMGCFESPTGTGKSLSAICASFDWLLKEEKRILNEYAAAEAASKSTPVASGDDWLTSLYSSNNATVDTDNKAASVDKYKLMLEKIAKSNDKKHQQSSMMLHREIAKRSAAKNTTSTTNTEHTTSTTTPSTAESEDAEFALKPYDSEDETRTHSEYLDNSNSDHSDSDNSTSHTHRNSHKPHKPQSIMDKLKLPQIFYCSRTHSQLAQFVAEMNKTVYCKIDPETNLAPIRCVTLGSRRNLCVNESVVKLKSESSMSEACLEMQKKGSKSSSGAGAGVAANSKTAGGKRVKLHHLAKCPHHQRAQEQALSQRSLAAVRDIEDIRNMGVESGTCAYYATRGSVRSANVVCLPYNLMLNRDMRESLGLSLEGKVIIFDEAHNLIETINAQYSAELAVTQIDASTSAIAVYLRRYSTVLNNKNLYYVNLLSVVLGKVRKVLCPKVAGNKNKNSTSSSAGGGSNSNANTTDINTTVTPHTTTTTTTTTTTPATTNSTTTVNDFLFASKLDNINLFKLRRHILDTNLVNKIAGYVDSVAQREAAGVVSSSGGTTPTATTPITPPLRVNVVSALRSALELVTCLTNLEGDGRIFILNIPSTATSTNNSASSSTASSANYTSNNNHSTNPNPNTTSTATTPTTTIIPTIRYVMLNPSVHFLSLLTSARSVLLLGGTMQPFQYFTSLLLPSIPNTRLRLFSCEHVVPATQVGAVVVPCAYTTYTTANHTNTTTSSSHTDNSTTYATHTKRVNFEFTFDKRHSTELTTALFYTLLEICSNTPGGVVVFCTSFSYLDVLLQRWRSSKLLYKLDAVKRVFAESRSGDHHTTHTNNTTTNTNTTTNNIDSDLVWAAYTAHLTANPVEGGVLFSVINGKLSEGINFSDYLARCVVVVGMPYPDTRDVVLQEKMRYVTQKENSGTSGGSSGTSTNTSAIISATTNTTANISTTNTTITNYNTPAGRRLCENMCMRAVNQSVGRAIRHISDYACVVLLDRRYAQEHMRAQLPRWLMRNLQVCAGSGDGNRGNSTSGSRATVSSSGGNGSEGRLSEALQKFFLQQQV